MALKPQLYSTAYIHFFIILIPHTIVSDNTPLFASNEFEEFCQINGIKYITTYHPSANAAAERAVQMFKSVMQKICHTNSRMTLKALSSRGDEWIKRSVESKIKTFNV